MVKLTQYPGRLCDRDYWKKNFYNILKQHDIQSNYTNNIFGYIVTYNEKVYPLIKSSDKCLLFELNFDNPYAKTFSITKLIDYNKIIEVEELTEKYMDEIIFHTNDVLWQFDECRKDIIMGYCMNV